MQPAAGLAPVQADVKARRFRLASQPTATVLGALVFVLTVIAVPLASLTVINVGSDLLNLIFAGVGVVVARRQPRNPARDYTSGKYTLSLDSRTIWFSRLADQQEVRDMPGAYSTEGYVAFRIYEPGGVAHATAAARTVKRQSQA
jgi:hypothetical protein